MSESDVYGRQIMTSNDGPRAERVDYLNCKNFMCVGILNERHSNIIDNIQNERHSKYASMRSVLFTSRILTCNILPFLFYWGHSLLVYTGTRCHL